MGREPGPLERGAFVERFGGVYEHSPWIAREAFERGALPAFLTDPADPRGPAGALRSVDEARALGEALARVLARADDGRKLELIRAHPDLVGRAALAGELGAASADEQASAGLDRCTAEELARFRAANAAYRERFGFPFVMAVRGASRAAILEAFEARLGNAPEAERARALAEIDRIALLRLEAIAAEDAAATGRSGGAAPGVTAGTAPSATGRSGA